MFKEGMRMLGEPNVGNDSSVTYIVTQGFHNQFKEIKISNVEINEKVCTYHMGKQIVSN